MSEFNFSNITETNFVGSQSQHLKAYGIYEVKLTKIALETIKGKKDPTAEYKTVVLEFTGTDKNPGTFNQNIFLPTSEDIQRPTFKNANGHEYERPSRFENFKYTLMQIVEVINPTGAANIKKVAGKIKTVEDFVNCIIKALNGKNDVVTEIKLVGRNNNGVIYAALPAACGLSKSGEIFPVNFIGNNLFFTPYEESQRKNLDKAKPTPVVEEDLDQNDDDIDGLLNDI